MVDLTELNTKRNVPLLALFLAFCLRMPRSGAIRRETGGRPLGEIARQPAYLVAVAGAVVGYGVMNFIMIATPIAMHDHAHRFLDTAFVIQRHVFAMFVPSFFTGQLIRKFGTVSATSLSSGAVQNILGWQIINMAVIPFLLAVFLANLWLRSTPGSQIETQ